MTQPHSSGQGSNANVELENAAPAAKPATAPRAGLGRSLLISFGMFLFLLVALVVFIMVLAPDLLPFDYAGFD